jgi:hypothetical protein
MAEEERNYLIGTQWELKIFTYSNMEVNNSYHEIRTLEIRITEARSYIAKTTNENVKTAWNIIIADWEETLAKKKTDIVELISKLVSAPK